jgi:hypothetical protein
MNEKLRAAIERYDAQGYELQLLTPDACAILRRSDDWISLRLIDGDILTARLVPVRSGWSRLARPLALLVLTIGVASAAVRTGLAETEPPPALTASATASISATAIPATGTILLGGIPRAGGFGLFVFGGGTDDQLVAASGCPLSTAAFWATNELGHFVTYVPTAAVASVNGPWRARFRSGIPLGTPLLGQCVPLTPIDSGATAPSPAPIATPMLP